MNNANFKFSSYLTSPIFMVFALVCACVCAHAGLVVLSGYLFFLCLLALASFLWGRFSAHALDVTLKADTYRVYPEQEVTMQFSLCNNKLLPLVWLEWVQTYPPRGCLAAPDDFEVCDVTNPMAQTVITPMLCKRFSFIRWYETIEWTATFRAVRRGVYSPDTIALHTGDGFGLNVRKEHRTLTTPPVFVVYPRRVAVSTDAFFQNAWSASTGPRGVIEDVTVLRSTRAYQQNDSFKRINWRMAARGEELSVNLYDTIAPRSVYFFIDTASFFGLCPADAENEAFERTLSVVASLIAELSTLGMSVVLYLPVHSSDAPAAPQSECSECLLALARLKCDDASAHFSQQSLSRLYATQSGNIYYVCYDAAQCAQRVEAMFEEVGISTFSLISCTHPTQQSEGAPAATHHIHLLSDFQKG